MYRLNRLFCFQNPLLRFNRKSRSHTRIELKNVHVRIYTRRYSV
ncbi:hypothetical protein Hdeb2414_s0453g00897321 [Helianthus debilis subsp. tardiflorus]